MMRWRQKLPAARDHLVVSWSGQTLVYVLARDHGSRGHEVLQAGVERQEEGAGDRGLADLVRRLKALALDGLRVSAMLRAEQYQVLRIRAPAVAPEELRAAARYQVIKMLDTHVDDVTIEVMRVGDGRARDAGHLATHLFVVAARRTAIRDVLDLRDAMAWRVSVIDIQETAQRNLQTALASADAHPGRANAALVLVDPLQAVLTIVANGELFTTRRFALPRGFLRGAWEDTLPALSTSPADPASIAPIAAAARRWGNFDQDAMANEFLLEVQRSLDLWDRIWSSLPLDGLSLYAGARTGALCGWLTQHLGQTVRPLDPAVLFTGFQSMSPAQQASCLPLLGVLLRPENRFP